MSRGLKHLDCKVVGARSVQWRRDAYGATHSAESDKSSRR